MELATTTGDFGIYSMDIEQLIAYLGRTKFKNIDLSMDQEILKENAELLGDNWKENVKKIRAFAEGKGLKFVQAHAPMGKPIVKDENYDDFMFFTTRSIEIAAELGIKNIVVHSGYDMFLSKEECFIKNKEFYDKLLTLAENKKINILTENFNKMCDKDVYWIDSAQDVRELIDFVKHPLFHACWDTGHGNMQQTTQYDALQILGEHVYALHVQDNLGERDDHYAPFFGNMDIDSLMNGLNEIGYKGYFTFESDRMMLARERSLKCLNGKLSTAPIEIRIKAENLLYEIGECILDAYGQLDK